MNGHGDANGALNSQHNNHGQDGMHKASTNSKIGASVDPAYNAIDEDDHERRESTESLESDLELDDMEVDYPRVRDDEEAGLRAGAREDHAGPSNPDDLGARRASVESVDMWQDAARMGNIAFLRKAGINASLILLWYVFSICISVVSTRETMEQVLQAHMRVVQQMDVLSRQSRLSLSIVHDIFPHGGSIHPCFACSAVYPIIST